MNRFLLLLCLLVLAFYFSPTSAATPVGTLSATPLATKTNGTLKWKQHCAAVATTPDLFIKTISRAENRLSFTNHGGLFNGGVCWWHSRLIRAAQYLAVFDSSAPPPTTKEAYDLILRLRNGRPVTIPGFNTLHEFSTAFYEVIQKNLEEWQISNGGFAFGFLDGLVGSTTVPAAELKLLMDEAYHEFSTNRKPLFQVLQLPGITAHAWIITDMNPTVNGYLFTVVDSNYLATQTWSYRYGETNFLYGRSPFVSYTTKRGIKEEALLSKRLNDACLSLQTKGKLADAPLTIDEELDLLMAPPVPN